MELFALALMLTLLPVLLTLSSADAGRATRFVRFSAGGRIGYGILEGESIRELDADFLAGGKPTGRSLPLSEVRLLAPCTPSKVIAVGLNYRSHLGTRPAPQEPGLFAKLPSSIVGPEDEILFPPGATDVHYEGELVVIIGKPASKVTAEAAGDCIFGVTAGNDVSERQWQKGDLQWLRAKGSDTFGPIGPAVVQGLDYDNLKLETRVNGEVRQSQRTSDLIFDVRRIVSYASQYITLMPGDAIFTGTPGTTQALKPGDVVEVEIEGIGVLRNRVGRQ